MIRISESAAEVLHDSLLASKVDSVRALRLKQNGSQFVLELDVPGMSDRIVQHEGVAILLIDLRLERRIGDALIDVNDDAKDLQLFMHSAT